MLSYFTGRSQPAGKTTESSNSNAKTERKEQEDARAALQRAMHVHDIKANINFEPGVITTREDITGVPEAFLLHSVLTPKECKRFIELTEELGFTDAPITTGLNSAAMMKDVRDNLRVMLTATDEMLASIWERVVPLIPETVAFGSSGREWHIAKDLPLNERFRFYRYDDEQVFQPHFDGCFPRSREEQSHFTFIIYLNDGFDGGETTFFPGNCNSMWVSKKTHKEVRINPIAGSAVLFRHTGTNSPLHEGSPHHSKGMRKYVLRTDVMYKVKSDGEDVR